MENRMTRTAHIAVWGLLAIGGFATFGCTVHAHGPDVVIGEPPVTYVYDDYYDRGHWDGDYWVWRDRDGHFFHERRELYERRVRERGDHDHDRDHR
jgi:hypothetical protein